MVVVESLGHVWLLQPHGQQVPPSVGFSKQEYWMEWVIISSSRGSSWSRDRISVHIGRLVLYQLSHEGNPYQNIGIFKTAVEYMYYTKISDRTERGCNKTLIGISWHDQISNNICCQGRNYIPFLPIFSWTYCTNTTSLTRKCGKQWEIPELEHIPSLPTTGWLLIINRPGISLVLQWLRTGLPIQGTQVWSLVQRSHMLWGN